ncbi:hypothetical protein [Verrucomicrobium sp. BvORR106]|uniref:hypothetical protein n=1 Tax=Verrucomicrobium sp. BvORR106 TaxID=1403819 RepID=UPI00068F9B43|nr:hypothetical protein [Verrucomicrobium sp. BvORR106]
MKRIALHFPKVWKAALYLFFALSWLSGTGWFALHRWVTVEGEFGPQPSSWEGPLLKLHGGAAMMMMVYYGYLLASHIPVGFRSGRSRVTGLFLAISLGFMIVTAYGLYYIGDEDVRGVIAWAHLCTGVLIPLVLIIHVWLGHRQRSSQIRETGALRLPGLRHIATSSMTDET